MGVIVTSFDPRRLRADGWKAKVDRRAGGGTMIAARRGATNKLGYIAAHSAIVLVCIGGLFDGDLIVKAQMVLQGKSSYAGGGTFRGILGGDVGDLGRLLFGQRDAGHHRIGAVATAAATTTATTTLSVRRRATDHKRQPERRDTNCLHVPNP